MWLKLNQSVSQTNKKNLHSGLNLMHWVPGCKENPILSPLVSDDFLSSFPPVRSYVPPWCLAPLSPFLPSLSGLSLHAPCFQCQLVFVFWKVPVQSWLHQPVCKQNNIFFWKKTHQSWISILGRDFHQHLCRCFKTFSPKKVCWDKLPSSWPSFYSEHGSRLEYLVQRKDSGILAFSSPPLGLAVSGLHGWICSLVDLHVSLGTA